MRDIRYGNLALLNRLNGLKALLRDGLKSDFNERYKIWKPDFTEGTDWTEGFAEGWIET
jgi:hypothetical protein